MYPCPQALSASLRLKRGKLWNGTRYCSSSSQAWEAEESLLSYEEHQGSGEVLERTRACQGAALLKAHIVW